jgi:DNA-binding response OmpR family regulator
VVAARFDDRRAYHPRRKNEPPSEVPTVIKSVRGVGYVFTGEVGAA